MADDNIPPLEEPKKKSRTMPLVILALVLLLVGGGGFFAYTTFMAPPATTAVPPTETTSVVGEMITLNEFVVNLADPKGKRYLKCKISLEVESVEAKERVAKIAPKLRDIVIMLLTSLAFEEVMTPEGKIRIRNELLERFNQAARPDRIRNLYFSDFVVQ
ncbi:MAG: flagellar basal body-associated FliL family protein [Desulfurivibrionaceae bacterium]|nr:flagellar basal body-associated FliL family protein [Desulfurivibrionaceae bacterium]